MLVIIIHIFTQHSLPFDSLITNGDFVVCNIVVYHHLSGTYHSNGTDLVWIKPAYMNVGQDFIRVKNAHKHHVIDTVLNKIDSPA